MYKRFPREMIWMVLLAVVLIGGGAWWLSHERPRKVAPARPMPVLPENIQVRLGKVRLQGISGGKLVWEIEAENFDFAKDRPVLTVTNLKKVAILNKGRQEVTLSADILERNTMSGRITISGNVTVQGPDLRMTADYASWDPRREALHFSKALTVQFGDYTLHCLGDTRFDVKSSEITTEDGVALTMQGNTLRAQSIRINLINQRIEMGGPVTAELSVAEMESWAAGHQVPAIPEIPTSIKERYREYCEKKTRTGPSGTFFPRRKGVRP